MRKCRHCRVEIPPLAKCKADPIRKGGFCGVECLADHARAKLAKKAKAERVKKLSAPKRDRTNDKPHQEKLTQEACNRMIRLLDQGMPCISCGRMACGSMWHAGHFRSVAACPELRFDPRNIYLQGSGCNTGNRRADKNTRRKAETIAQDYQQRLRDRVGDDLVDWVLGPHSMPHYSCDDLVALRAAFNAECRRLESGEGPSRDWRCAGYRVRELIG